MRAFFRERVEFYLRDARGFAYDVVNAVLASDAEDVVDAVARAEAVTRVRPSADFESISIACKRMKNILRQAEQGGKKPAATVDTAASARRGREAPGRARFHARQSAWMLCGQPADYDAALLEIAKLRPAVDQFFDKVMVMVDDERFEPTGWRCCRRY